VPVEDRATATGRPAVFGTVGRTTDRAALQKQLVPEVPRPSRLEPTMPGRRFGDLEQQLVDVQREPSLQHGFRGEFAGDVPYVSIGIV
jgi:hypothetical protein